MQITGSVSFCGSLLRLRFHFLFRFHCFFWFRSPCVLLSLGAFFPRGAFPCLVRLSDIPARGGRALPLPFPGLSSGVDQGGAIQRVPG